MKASLINGLAAAAIAVGGLAPLATPASAAGVTFSFGAPTRHSEMHMGRQAFQVCRTKYRVSWWGGKPHRIPVGNECTWEYPNKPVLTFKFGGQNDDGPRYRQYNQYNQFRPY
jgi:hypothetical protein